VLVDAETISASERVLMFLMQLPNATTIGVTSNGAQATSIGIQAPNGWGVQLPVQEIIAGDGEMYEPHGIPVDIEMLNDPEDVAAGTDEVLEYAIGLATGTATR
jgi:C-terminal processing protease CtpA/Prc